MYDGATPLVAVPLVRELRRVALRDAQAALGEVELVGGLPEDLQHEGLEAGHLHALGQLPDERERLELEQDLMVCCVKGRTRRGDMRYAGDCFEWRKGSCPEIPLLLGAMT